MCIRDSLNMNQSAISHQLRVLKQSKLVKYRRDGKTVFYSLADGHVRTILGPVSYTHLDVYKRQSPSRPTPG